MILALLQLPESLSSGEVPSSVFAAGGAALAAVVVFGMVLFFASRYKRCPANKILVISGSVGGGNAAKCISGGGAFVWPVIQEYAYLGLEPMRLDVPLGDALSLENIRISVPAVFTVAIGTEPEVRQNAAIRLLGMTPESIEGTAHDIIVGQLRAVIAAMKIDEINRDRDGFLHKVQSQLEPELRKIGLVLINVNIKDLRDASGYLEALGKQAAQQAIQQARGDVAEQEKLGEIRVAQAEREKVTAVADAEKLREIALRETLREQAVRLAELDKEQAVGEQTAALERDAQVKDAQRTQSIRIAQLDKEQRIAEQTAGFEREAAVAAADQKKRVAIAEANAAAIAGEADAQGRIAATNSALAVRNAEAYQTAETRKREAEAAVQEAQNRAMARAALAEAERVEAEQRARLEAPAKAEKARTIVEAQAEAERARIAADAEAAARYAVLEAEAKGQFEIMSRKADAIARMVQAAGGDPKAAFQLMMVEQLPQLAETAARAISNIKFDKVVVWEGGNASGDGAAVGGSAGFIQNLARSMPPMMQVLRDVAGVEMPSFLGTMTPDAPGAASLPPTVVTPASAQAEVSGAGSATPTA
ncbi:flotillin family protein [Roseisolibacter sp. H3M3-2]|uniref:flotillin family protein n=1 Tax=Roseisolibacter sp. H3M3-2 TaxID=3031323 RepID=UPI0023DA6589|nr:flotillin family protein [Roseisolibacter sp. H3M3-2]MDF1504320.1 SPFH domain-containing protein [Roseisolibacter sp. H3M3-2]